MSVSLMIRALSLNERPLSQPIQGVFDENGGSVGRGDSNNMTLPDPERLISRVHAQVTWNQGAFWIQDVGKGVASLLNGRPIGDGGPVRLKSGDELRIGGYRLVAELLDQASESLQRQRTITRQLSQRRTGGAAADAPVPRRSPPPAAPARPVPPAAPAPDPFAGLGLPPSSYDSGDPFGNLIGAQDAGGVPGSLDSGPFADLLGHARAAGAGPSPGARREELDPFTGIHPPGSLGGGAPGAAGASSRLPDDFDPFADPPEQAAARPLPADPASDPLDIIRRPGSKPGDIDALFGLGPSQGQPPGQDPLADFAAPRPPASGGALPLDPLLLFGATPPAKPAGPPAANHTPELQGAYAPPRIVDPAAPRPGSNKPPADRPVPERPGAPRPGPARPLAAKAEPERPVAGKPAKPTAASPEVRQLWRAFLEGAGLPADFARVPDTHMMLMIGSMLREFTEGTLQLIQMRAAEKNQLRTSMTVIRARDNNPLKFSADGAAALAQMLRAPAPGFVSSPVAVRGAMNDLRSHQVGTMAGMRAALAGVMDRFEPAMLERQLTRSSALENLMPAIRRAKLWDLYVSFFETVRHDAEEDFHRFFADAFVAAYEEQVDRLERAQAGQRPDSGKPT